MVSRWLYSFLQDCKESSEPLHSFKKSKCLSFSRSGKECLIFTQRATLESWISRWSTLKYEVMLRECYGETSHSMTVNERVLCKTLFQTKRWWVYLRQVKTSHHDAVTRPLQNLPDAIVKPERRTIQRSVDLTPIQPRPDVFWFFFYKKVIFNGFTNLLIKFKTQNLSDQNHVHLLIRKESRTRPEEHHLEIYWTSRTSNWNWEWP